MTAAGRGLAASLTGLVAAVALDWRFLRFAARKSAAFAVAAAVLHVLHRAAGALGFVAGLLLPPPRLASVSAGDLRSEP